MNQQLKFTNDLIHESSPYLLQHAHNPVNWKAWSDKTWDKAIIENKLVIVSIGYSTCHWCHVMEKECFENEESAHKMNEAFVSIKVDREERPDVDQIYMDACQLMTGRGGWPLNVICLPDKRPVYAGTYFPKQHWDDLLGQLKNLWSTDPQKVMEYADRIVSGMKQMNLQEFAPKTTFSRQDLETITSNLSASFDFENGGLARQQKFLLPGVLEYLLDDYLCTGNQNSLDFANFTLLKMANSGIHDHLRGGFYRYATDVQWFAPHFEKMLYDNAQMLGLYARAFSITKAPLYKQVAEGVFHFISRELKCPTGGYYSALDADSEGIEGRFYVFTQQELTETLNDEELHFANVVYNFSSKGNWEHGYNILHKTMSPAELVANLNIGQKEFHALLNQVNSKLLALQNTRIRPSLDDKILCSWNGLLLKSLSQAALYLEDESIATQAMLLGDWMLATLVQPEGLVRVNSKHFNPAFSEDYACFIEGLVQLYELDGNAKWLEASVQLTDTLIVQYHDPEKQWFAFTPIHSQPLIIHKYDTSDDVIPASNSIMAIQLQKLGVLCDRYDYVLMGREMIKPLRSAVLEKPEWYCNWSRVAQLEAIGFIQIAITGAEGNKPMKSLIPTLPSWVALGVEAENPAPFLKHKMGTTQSIFICINETCFEPVAHLGQAIEVLEDLLRPS